jgi:hypothetical protein
MHELSFLVGDVPEYENILFVFEPENKSDSHEHHLVGLIRRFDFSAVISSSSVYLSNKKDRSKKYFLVGEW